MKRIHILLVTVILLSIFTGQCLGAGNGRILSVRVVDVAGRPAGGTTVTLAGSIGWGEFINPDLPEAKGWKTDTEGRVQIAFANRKSETGKSVFQLGGDPGWGRFYLVADPKVNGLGGISGPIINPSGPADENLKYVSAGGVALGEKPVEVELRLRRAIAIEGIVTEPDGRPFKGALIKISNDLHADSHTGRGGEIFRRQAESGPDGRFEIANAYPAFGLTVESSGAWLRIKFGRDGEWRDAEENLGHDDKTSTNTFVTIIVATKKIKVFGTVTNTAGAVVGGAKVNIWVNRYLHPERPPRLPVTALTNPVGYYEISLATPWIQTMIAEKDGYIPLRIGVEAGDQGDQPLAPGRHDFTLQNKE